MNLLLYGVGVFLYFALGVAMGFLPITLAFVVIGIGILIYKKSK